MNAHLLGASVDVTTRRTLKWPTLFCEHFLRPQLTRKLTTSSIACFLSEPHAGPSKTVAESRHVCPGGGSAAALRGAASVLPVPGAHGLRGLRQSPAAGEAVRPAETEARRGPGAGQGLRAQLRRADGQAGPVRAAASPAGHPGHGGGRHHRSGRKRGAGPKGEDGQATLLILKFSVAIFFFFFYVCEEGWQPRLFKNIRG